MSIGLFGGFDIVKSSRFISTAREKVSYFLTHVSPYFISLNRRYPYNASAFSVVLAKDQHPQLVNEANTGLLASRPVALPIQNLQQLIT